MVVNQRAEQTLPDRRQPWLLSGGRWKITSGLAAVLMRLSVVSSARATCRHSHGAHCTTSKAAPTGASSSRTTMLPSQQTSPSMLLHGSSLPGAQSYRWPLLPSCSASCRQRQAPCFPNPTMLSCAAMTRRSQLSSRARSSSTFEVRSMRGRPSYFSRSCLSTPSSIGFRHCHSRSRSRPEAPVSPTPLSSHRQTQTLRWRLLPPPAQSPPTSHAHPSQ
mmetsp:Transcript_21700/g.55417  ORF Transcript_21700/g.55417 Transcript_21700/m.55417 type:complete len:219 (+) Transcript_21700:57-713(+)